MKSIIGKIVRLSALTLFSPMALAAAEDDPLLTMVKIDQFEVRDANEGSVVAWEGFVWVGKDLNKLWIKTEGEKTSDETEGAEIQLLYSRAIDNNWDIQLGFKHDAYPDPTRDWLAIGFSGIAPYWFEIDSALFIGEEVNSLRFQAEYEFMLTQRWVLVPEVELNWFSDDDIEIGIGKGFANIEAGLRLRYEIDRQLAPYIGINYESLLGDTKDLASAANAETDDSQLVLGLGFWF
jgi:copper resistance protein B